MSNAHSQWGATPGPNFDVGGAPFAEYAEEPVYITRSGSPMSIQEQQTRRLQVANAVPSLYDDPFETASFSAAGAAVSASTSELQLDGKGRPLLGSSVEAPFVHLDGGKYQDPARGTSSSVGAAAGASGPPAYAA